MACLTKGRACGRVPGFGVADWYLGQGEEAKAIPLLTQVADSSYWPSFAACAAEAELLRLRPSAPPTTNSCATHRSAFWNPTMIRKMADRLP